jgi:hypothetical protein
MSRQPKAVTFLATFPPIQSAIKVGRDGARVQLDIPASELPAVVRLLGLQAKEIVLQVMVKGIEGEAEDE